MRKFITIFISALFFLIVVGFLKEGLKLSDRAFWTAYWIIGLTVVIICLLVDIVWYLKFSKKVASLTSILKDELNPQKYIEENEKLLKNKRSKTIIAVLKINIAAGYCDKKEFQKAKEIMQELPKKGVKGINKVIFDLNMAYIHYRLGEKTEFEKVMFDNRDFIKFEKVNNLGGTIAVLNIFKLISEDKKEEAYEKLLVSKEKWLNKRNEEDFLELEKQINKL